MDAGYLEAEMMFKNGASFVVVMGQAHEHTIREAVRAAKDYGRYVMGDIMLCPDKVAMARKMEAMGVDVVIVHTGLDERHAEKGKSPLDDLKKVRPSVRIPLQAVGGRQSSRRRNARARSVARGDRRAIGGRHYELKPGRTAKRSTRRSRASSTG